MPAPGFDRITLDPKQLDGQPCIRHMRLTVRRVLGTVSLYPNCEKRFRKHPELQEPERMEAASRQVFHFAATSLEAGSYCQVAES